MQTAMLRTSAFSGVNVQRPTAFSRSVVSRTPVVVVKAVQDVKGVVVSTAMENTVVVNVERLAPHPKYFKRIRASKRYFAHVEADQQVQLGDYVRLEGCRPLSKNKRFKLAEIIRGADK